MGVTYHIAKECNPPGQRRPVKVDAKMQKHFDETFGLCNR